MFSNYKSINENSLPLVSICCVTYNHKDYISEAIDSFLKQKTNFHYEIIIHDDASTDGTREIIKSYEERFPDIIKPIYQFENQYSKGIKVTPIAISHSKGKYIALCEGDDYWTDSLKLQKQVDFLEKNSDYDLVHTSFSRYYQVENVLVPNIKKGKYYPPLLYDYLLKSNPITTCTTCIRKDIIMNYLLEIPNDKILSWKVGDFPLWMYISLKSKIKFLPDSTAVYRILEKSAINTSVKGKLLHKLSSLRIKLFYLLNFKFKFLAFIFLLVEYLKTLIVFFIKINLNKVGIYNPDRSKSIKKALFKIDRH